MDPCVLHNIRHLRLQVPFLRRERTLPELWPSECDDVIRRARISNGNRLLHREVTDGLLHPPLLEGGQSNPSVTRADSQKGRWGGGDVTELSDWPRLELQRERLRITHVPMEDVHLRVREGAYEPLDREDGLPVPASVDHKPFACDDVISRALRQQVQRAAGYCISQERGHC